MNNLENKNIEEVKDLNQVQVVAETEHETGENENFKKNVVKQKEEIDFFENDDDDEFVEIDGKLVYELKYPIKFDGREIKELTFDFVNIEGGQLRKILMEVKALLGKKAGQELVVPAVNVDYQVAVAAKACGESTSLIYKLKMTDYTAITMRASNFLLGSK